MDWTWYLFRFDGRINRALLWQALLIVALLAMLAGMIDQAIHVAQGQTTFKFSFEFDFDFGLDGLFRVIDPRAYRLLPAADRTTLTLKVIATALFLWIYLATTIKRLHDRNRSGRWIIPFFFVPGLINQFTDPLPHAYWMIPLDVTAVTLWL